MIGLSQRTDVVCAGGGPAGLAAAIALRLHGFRVLVVDTSVPPVDKACGEGLMPDGVAALRALGVSAEQHAHAQFRGIRFIGSDGLAEAVFPTGYGIGMRRTELHDALRQRAEELGVELRWGARLGGIGNTGAFIDAQAIESQWIVGADGQNSRIREWAGLSCGSRTVLRIGLRRHFRISRWTDLVEVHWGDSGQAYVTPIAPNEICVAVISRDPRVRFDELIAECPELSFRLRDAQPLDSVRGSATATLTLRSVIAGNVALVGEASGSVDAVTGEGMTMAFRQAVELGKAMAANDLSSYQGAHRKIAHLPQLLGRAMLWMDRSAQFRSRALKVLSKNPALFPRLLAVHLGEQSPLQFGVSGMVTLGWQLLAG